MSFAQEGGLMVEQEPKIQMTRTEFEEKINEAIGCLWKGWAELGLEVEPGSIIDGEVLDEVDVAHSHAKIENVCRNILNDVAEIVEENDK